MSLVRQSLKPMLMAGFVAIATTSLAQEYFSTGIGSNSEISTHHADLIDATLVDTSAGQVSPVGAYYNIQNCDSSCDSSYSSDAGCQCGCSTSSKKCCTCKEIEAANKAAASAYKGVFYDNNFDYICDPCYQDWHLGDLLKRRSIGPLIIDVGGQYRSRFHNENGMRGPSPGISNSFLLGRSRIFANAELGPFRAYVEGLDAQSNYERLAPRGIDENRMDFQNLFGDLTLLDGCCDGKLIARVGRQELLYGEQRAVSPLDWANVRRTFQGYKLMWKTDKWSVDGFWTNPMRKITDRMDSPDRDIEFFGAYSTYKASPTQTVDLFYLGLNNLAAGNFRYDTVGGRWKGKTDVVEWDLWSAVQWGNMGAYQHRAGAWTAGLGKSFDDICWTPSLWVYYDWASGSNISRNGYDHLYPLAHKYLGFMDFFGRRNITDLNAIYTVQPCERFKVLAWWHYFNREDGDDTPYDVVMQPFGTANGSSYLGQELDLMGSIKVSDRSSLVLGYSHFFAGTYFDANPNIPFADGADFVWTQFQIDF